MNRKSLAEIFNENFEVNSDQLEFYFCPFAINLMGNHLESVGGNILSFNIDKGLYAIVRKTNSRNIHLKFNFTKEEIDLNFDKTKTVVSETHWMKHLVSKINLNKNHTSDSKGCEIFIYSELNDIDQFSSTSSLAVLIDFILNSGTLNSCEYSNWENASAIEKRMFSEQIALENSKKGNAFLFNYQDKKWENIPINFGNYRLAIIYSNQYKKDNSDLNINRSLDFDNALNAIKNHMDINFLCDAQFKDMVYLEDELLSKRAMYCISENIRVESLVEVINDNFIEHMGKLLTASHQSLIGEFETENSLFNSLAVFSSTLDHCIGSRMVDTDFGAYIISLVHQNYIANFAEQLKLNSISKFNINVEVIFPKTIQGVCKI